MNKKVFLTLIMISLYLQPLTIHAGNLDSPAAPGDPNSGMYTMEDIHNRLKTGADGVKRPGGFTEPATAPGDSIRPTADDLMSGAPAADNTNGVMPSEVPCGKTYWGLRTDAVGGWGLQRGTLNCTP